MDINEFEMKLQKLNEKFQKKYVLTKKNLKKSPIERFFMLHKMNAILFVTTFSSFFVAHYFFSFDQMFVFTIFACFLSIFVSIVYSFKFVQPLLIRIKYEGYERHLFSKHIALQELLLTTAIAFLIGVIPTYFAYYNFDESSFRYLFFNALSIWLTCVAGGQKCMLEHARTVWIANRDR